MKIGRLPASIKHATGEKGTRGGGGGGRRQCASCTVLHSKDNAAVCAGVVMGGCRNLRLDANVVHNSRGTEPRARLEAELEAAGPVEVRVKPSLQAGLFDCCHADMASDISPRDFVRIFSVFESLKLL